MTSRSIRGSGCNAVKDLSILLGLVSLEGEVAQ